MSLTVTVLYSHETFSVLLFLDFPVVLVNLPLNFNQCSVFLLSKVLALGLCRLAGPDSQRMTSSIN